YDVILSAPELTIERCLTINPADRVVLSDEGIPHECTTEAEKFLKARDDLENQPLQNAQIVLFVDSSCYRANDGNKAGYAVVMHNEEDDSFRVLASVSVPQSCSAQLAEIKALTAACRLGAGGRCTIYTDSAYAHGVCHTFGPIWEQRGFQRADGSSILHGPAISDLLKAMMLPKALAIVKCKAHKSDGDMVSRGNAAADEAVKNAALGKDCVKVMMVQDEEHEEVRGQVTEEDLGEYQDVASGEEKERWRKRGAVQDPNTGLWRSIDGVWVAPLALLPTLIAEAHGIDHCNRRETIDTIRRNWWLPYLASMVDKFLRSCELCAARNVRKHFTAPISHIPEPRGPFRHLMMDFVDMADRKEGKIYILVVIDSFSRWVEATATAKNDAKTVAKFLIREQRMGCVYHPQSQGMVERANGVLKEKIANICASTGLNWVQALPLALMKMRSQTNHNTHLTPHELLTGRPMPVAFTQGPYTGSSLEQLEADMSSYCKHLTQIHRTLYLQVREATHGAQVDEPLQQVQPGDYVYIKVFKRKHWSEPRREGPFKVVLATPTAVKVEGKEYWYHLNHCCRAAV
ncbi:hypothetical protein C0J45_23928, partial [Silurus meridionalis]